MYLYDLLSYPPSIFLMNTIFECNVLFSEHEKFYISLLVYLKFPFVFFICLCVKIEHKQIICLFLPCYFSYPMLIDYSGLLVILPSCPHVQKKICLTTHSSSEFSKCKNSCH